MTCACTLDVLCAKHEAQIRELESECFDEPLEDSGSSAYTTNGVREISTKEASPMLSLLTTTEIQAARVLREANDATRIELAVAEAMAVAGLGYDREAFATEEAPVDVSVGCTCWEHPFLARLAAVQDKRMHFNPHYASGVAYSLDEAYRVPGWALELAREVYRGRGGEALDGLDWKMLSETGLGWVIGTLNEGREWEVCRAKRHFPEADISHRCYGEDAAAEHERWDAVEMLKRTFNHLRDTFGDDPDRPVDRGHENRDRIEGLWDGEWNPERMWFVPEEDSTDLLDVIRREEREAEEAVFQASVSWSPVTTYCRVGAVSRKRGRTLTPEMRKRNETRALLAKAATLKANRARLVELIRAAGADPLAPEVGEWVRGCIAKRNGHAARGYALAIEKLERKLACGVAVAA